MTTVSRWDECLSHPRDGQHECMAEERRCVYCGKTLEPDTCNGCGQFGDRFHEQLTAADDEIERLRAALRETVSVLEASGAEGPLLDMLVAALDEESSNR